MSYTYNAIGNITSKTVGTVVLDYKKYAWGHKHAVKEIEYDGTTYTYTYDANGNMQTGYDFRDLNDVATVTITSDADNMPTQVVYTKGGSSTTISFTYDGDGVRAIKAVQGGSTTYYAGMYYEITDGVATKYIFAADMRIAKLKGTELHYFHKDHLGSSTVMTDESSSKVEGTEYMPFGQIRDHIGTDVSKYKFTDQELDSETGLYNYDARLYDPVIGRFVSPDSIVPALYDPQSLNRYSYCRNNPLRYVDPSGHVEDDTTEADGKDTENEGGKDTGDTEEKGFIGKLLDWAKDYGSPDRNKDGYITDQEVHESFVRAAIAAAAAVFGIEIVDKEKQPNKEHFSDEKKALLDMAKEDKKKGGITLGDMEAYKELNKDLPDPFPSNKVRGPEIHQNRRHGQKPHGHVGPVHHIPIKKKQ
ncbi:MAG: RHS repeat-associated core domain-containing protein [Deltaproteobacteria bacterium]|nr:RHS repeat-associated core domain-containing protein [Deltaproteobacteria bacterium]